MVQAVTCRQIGLRRSEIADVRMFMRENHTLRIVFPVLFAGFLLFSLAGLTQSPEQADNSGGSAVLEALNAEPGTENGFEEIYSEGGQNAVYINWEIPATNGSSCTWFLGAYRMISGHGSNGVTEFRRNGVSASESLCVDLDRTVLRSTDLYCAINISYSDGRAGQPAPPSDSSVEQTLPSLILSLSDTNGHILVESGNLLALTNMVWYADATNVVLLLQLPTAKYPDAAVIQLRVSESDSSEKPGSPQARPPYTDISSKLEGEAACLAVASERREEPSRSGSAVVVRESLLFTDTAIELWASSGQNNGSTNYNNGSLSNFYDQVNGSGGNSSTNNSNGNGNGGNGNGQGDDDQDKNSKIIYVDQAIGNDVYSGRSAAVENGSPQVRPPYTDINSNLEGETACPAVASERRGEPSRSDSAAHKGPVKTIRRGLGIAKPDDTIIIKPGNYRENLNISGRPIKVIISGNVRL